MRKVLMFGWEFPPMMTGGLGVACEGLVHALSKRNDVQITLVLPYKSLTEIKNCSFVTPYKTISKIKFIETMVSSYDTNESYKQKLQQSERKLMGLSDNNLLDEIKKYASKVPYLFSKEEFDSFDVIHAHDWLTYLAGVKAKEISGKPLILHIHATGFNQSGGMKNQNSEMFKIERESMMYADKVIAVSNYIKDILIEHYEINPTKIEVIHNGVVLDSWEEIEHNISDNLPHPLISFIGRITIQKGPLHFIYAAKKVLEYNPNIYFMLAGTGDMLEECISKIGELGIQDNFIITKKFVNQKQIKWIHSHSEVFVMPSISEPFGIVPLEAMSCNVPTIITKQSGVSEILNHTLKVDFWDINKMANFMLSVTEYDILNKSLRKHGKSEASLLTWDLPAQKCVDIYNTLSR